MVAGKTIRALQDQLALKQRRQEAVVIFQVALAGETGGKIAGAATSPRTAGTCASRPEEAATGAMVTL
jgi:hypothetical protein